MYTRARLLMIIFCMAWNDELESSSSAYGIAASTSNRIRVLAGPGTGKSFAMKRRVARLLEVENVAPERILAVTFTRVAAEDLHRELVSMGLEGARSLQGRTLHSLAMSILMRNHVLPVLGRHPRPLNDFELEPLLCDLSRSHGDKNERKRMLKTYTAAWARLQAEQLEVKTPEDIAFERELLEWLGFHEAMLMDEVIPQLMRYLRDNPGASELNEYSHLLVDEYQDLNKAEQEVIRLLGQNASICVIGDDDQSIYSFKHAHPDGIREWSTVHQAEDHSIDECRRCPVTVVRMANALIAQNSERLGMTMSERVENGTGEVVVRQYNTAEAEAEAVATKINALIASGVAPKDIIVLAQRRNFALPIYLRLLHAGVPTKSYYAESALHAGDTRMAQERYAMLKLVCNNEDRVALRWLLGYEHKEWHSQQYKRVLEVVRGSTKSFWETMVDLMNGVITIPHTTQIKDRFTVIYNEWIGLSSTQDLITFLQQWLPENPETELLAAEVQQVIHRIDTPKNLLQELDLVLTEPDVPTEVTDVRIMSLHKSKGLSANYVFIVGCVEGLHPGKPKEDMTEEDRQRKLEEDRRLFYVGITRVKADPQNERSGYLALTYSQTMAAKDAFRSQIDPVRVEGQVAILRASRFLGEMAPHIPVAQFNRPL